MCVTTDARAGEVGMGQEASLAIERRAVAVEPRGEEDHDVGLLAQGLDLLGVDLLKGQWGHRLPHVEGLTDRSLGVRLAHFGCVVVYARVKKKVTEVETK